MESSTEGVSPASHDGAAPSPPSPSREDNEESVTDHRSPSTALLAAAGPPAPTTADATQSTTDRNDEADGEQTSAAPVPDMPVLHATAEESAKDASSCGSSPSSRSSSRARSSRSTPHDGSISTPPQGDDPTEEEGGFEGSSTDRDHDDDDNAFVPSSLQASSSASIPPSRPPPSPPAAPTSSATTGVPSTAAVTAAGTAGAAIRRWKENKDYLKLQRELNRILSAMDRTPLTDWSAQASLLSQLRKTIQTFKDVVGAVELPDGDHVAKSLRRALSPQNVVGVQRKALEVLESYVQFVNPAYPMTKDLPLFLPALLELLPQATMQVKGDILELLDRGVVRRLDHTALRSVAQGLLAALLNCLEESETSPMYRRAMALLEYVQVTLKHEDVATAAAHRMLSTSLYAAELRGGQVLPAYAWLMIRDAATVRAPALSAMKYFISMPVVPEEHSVPTESDRCSDVADGAPPSLKARAVSSIAGSCYVLPDWVGGDVSTVVAALLNSLQDTKEKTHRLALDVLAMICPLNGSGNNGGGCERHGSCAHTVAAAAFHYESVGRVPPAPPTSVNAAASCAPFTVDTHGELFSFEVKALLVAAAVQLLGTRCGTPSVARRVFQWLTVDPDDDGGGGGTSHHYPGLDDSPSAGVVDAAVGGVTASAYVRDVASYILSHGFHMVVQHWEMTWGTTASSASRDAAGGRPVSSSPQLLVQRQVSSELNALSHTAQSLTFGAAVRLSSAPSIAAALGGSVRGGGEGSGASTLPATATAASALATPLAWLRSFLLLFRYRSPSFGSDGGEGGGSPTALDSLRLSGIHDGTADPGVANYPFLLYVAPLVLPSLSHFLVEVPLALRRLTFSAPRVRHSSRSGQSSASEEEMWRVEVREMLRLLPWASFVQLDVATARAVEKLVQPILAQAAHRETDDERRDEENEVPDSTAAMEQLQRRVQQYMEQAFALATALEPGLIDATADQPLAAQEYVRASLDWLDAVASLLGMVLGALASTVRRTQRSPSDDAAFSRLPLLLSTANGLLRLLVQRMQRLMEPMLDAVLATASATNSTVIGADFFSCFLSSVDTRVLGRLRRATLSATNAIIVEDGAAESGDTSDAPAAVVATQRSVLPSTGACSVEVQKLLFRLHLTTLRFTAFQAQLHLRSQQQAVAGVLLDSAAEDGAGARERELARQTTVWLTCLCDAAAAAGTDAAASAAPLFFTRTVRLLLDILFRARGCLLPAAAYHVLECGCPASGDAADSVAFTDTYALASVVRCLWEGCCHAASRDAAADPANLTAAETSEPALLASSSCDIVADFCSEALLVLIAVSPPCARCLDVFILQSPADTAVHRLVGLHRHLTEMRAQQRRGPLLSAVAPESATLSELQDPGVLFLGLLIILDCLSGVGSGVGGGPAALSASASDAAESTRQLARAYLAQAVVQDLPSVLLPLFFSFVCPLVLPSREVGASGGRDDAARSPNSSPAPTFSAFSLTVLLPTVRRGSAASTANRLDEAHPDQRSTAAAEDTPLNCPARTYRNLEAFELVQYLFALLQLPTGTEWVRQAMQVPTPNSLRVLLRGLEAQSFMPPEKRPSSSSGTASPTANAAATTAATPAREGPSDTLFASTALLLMNLSRQSLLSLHWARMRQRDQAGGTRVGGSTSTNSSLDFPRGSEPPAQRHRSLLLDSLNCLNRLQELTQTGPRTQPHRTAVLTWQFTAAQFLPLLQLAVQADLHAAQAMLLAHLRGVVLYLDDVASTATTTPAAAATVTSTTQAAMMDGGVASRHRRPHALLRVGVAVAGQTDKLLVAGGGGPTLEMRKSFDVRNVASETAASAAPAGGSTSASTTPVLDDLKRVPPSVLSNKLLYAMIGEVVEHVLGNPYTAAADAAISAREVDTLVLWLRFYCEVMPYLYRDLVASVEVVVEVLLGALEPPSTTPPSSSSASLSPSLTTTPSTAHARVQCVCYATLTYIIRFLLSVGRTADVENYEAAVKTKEAMSWIASTFSQDDPVAQARTSTMWARSPVLAPLRTFLSRLVGAAVQCLRVCDAPLSAAQAITAGGNVNHILWGYDIDEEEETAMGWKDQSLAAKQPTQNGPASDLREHARCLLQLLSHSAGSQFLTTFVDHWCRTYAAQSSLWMFETAAQRQCRLQEQRRQLWASTSAPPSSPLAEAVNRGSGGGGAADVATTRAAAWVAKEEAQRAAHALLEDTGVSVVDVTAALTPLLRDATTTQQRVEQQQSKVEVASTTNNSSRDSRLESPSPPPPRVAQLLYFLNQLVETVCLMRRDGGGTGNGGLTECEADAVLGAVAEVVSQWPPEPLSFCCILHTLYCVVTYARDEATAAVVDSERGGKSSTGGSAGACSRSPSVRAATPAPLVTAAKVYQSKDYSFVLCRLLEGLSISPAASHRSAALLLLQVLCETFYVVLPSSLSAVDNPGRVVDAATRVFQRTLLPTLRRGIASVSEAEILSSAPLVNASLRVLRAAIAGFAPDLTFEKRMQRDIATLFFAEHFFRYSRSALHEWTLLLRQLCAVDHEFHSLLCERMVPSPGRLSAMMMSRETEALLRARSMKSLAFYTYAVMLSEETPAAPSGAVAAAVVADTTSASSAAGGGALSPGPGPTSMLLRHKELIHLLREQLTYTLQHFSPTTKPTVAQVTNKEVFLQPLCAAFLVFRVLLMSSTHESLVASLWPLVWPELLRALSIVVPVSTTTTSTSSSTSASDGATGKETASLSQNGTAALRTVLLLQMEALKVLDVDLTLYPAHAFAFRWLFTDDTALSDLLALQQQQRYYCSRRRTNGTLPTPSPFTMLLHTSVLRHLPLVSHLGVLYLLKKTPPVTLDSHLSVDGLVNTVHEPRPEPARGTDSDGNDKSVDFAPVLSTIQQWWPPCARPPDVDRGLRRPLYNIPVTHYRRLDGIYRAAQAFTVLLQRVNGDALLNASSPNLQDARSLTLLRTELCQCVGQHNEVDVAYMRDLVEADLTATDPDTML